MDSQVASFILSLSLLVLGERRALFAFSFLTIMDILVLEDAFKTFHYNASLSTLFFP